MEFSSSFTGDGQDIVNLFAATFSASENAGEGALIGDFIRRLLNGTAPADFRMFTARDKGALAGAALFTRLTYAHDERTVFILSPMAVATDRQGEGIGQSLLRFALAELRKEGTDIAITYGDPAFYGKVGFQPLTEAVAPPPLPLSQPMGWIGQSLTGAEVTPIKGPCSCVTALNDPRLW